MKSEKYSYYKGTEGVLSQANLLLESIFKKNKHARVGNILLKDPSTPSREIINLCGEKGSELIHVYSGLQKDPLFQYVAQSPFYSRRIMFNIARTITRDFDNDPDYIERLISGEPVTSRVVELHSTKATCNYNCVMCFWSNVNQTKNMMPEMHEGELMSVYDWKKMLFEIKKLGTKTAVFSGGGEPLLNPDFFEIINFAHQIGLKTQLYTNGFNMADLSENEWSCLLKMEKIRFSIHSPKENTYNQIVKLPAKVNALKKVAYNLSNLLEKREASGSMLKVGMGFVIQPYNALEIEEMVEFFLQSSADFINI